MPRRKPAPIHPGEILLEEFLTPLGISQYRLAKDISVPPRRINEIVRGQRSITADTVSAIGRVHFRTTDRFWSTCRYDTTWNYRRIDSGDRLDREVTRGDAQADRVSHVCPRHTWSSRVCHCPHDPCDPLACPGTQFLFSRLSPSLEAMRARQNQQHDGGHRESPRQAGTCLCR